MRVNITTNFTRCQEFFDKDLNKKLLACLDEIYTDLLENSIIFIDQKINRLLHTRKVIEGILNDLNRESVTSDAKYQPDPSPTNFPDSPNMSESLATGGAGVVPGPAILKREFSPSPQAERDTLADTPPLCIIGQGEYQYDITVPQPAEVKRVFVHTILCRAFRRLRQAVLKSRGDK